MNSEQIFKVKKMSLKISVKLKFAETKQKGTYGTC